MKVIINEGGLTCTTVNPFGIEPDTHDFVSEYDLNGEGAIRTVFHEKDYNKAVKLWQKAQDERQTFEIDYGKMKVSQKLTFYALEQMDNPKPGVSLLKPGTTHEAEIVNGKAVIK